MLISVGGTGKNRLQPGQESMGNALVLAHWSLILKILGQNQSVCWNIVVKEKPTDGSPFFGFFPSDRSPKATKDINVHFFIHSSNSCKYYNSEFL
jgi:hypothetical protein